MGEGTSQLGPGGVDELLRAGIAAAKAGERDRARELLMQVVEQTEESASAWLWLSGVVDSLEDREVCLENVLTLDPGNSAARKGLEWVRAQRQQQAPAPSAEAEPAWVVAAAPSAPTPRPDGPSTPEPLWNDPPSPLLCPYCAAQTREEDKHCPACENPLVLRVRRRETHSLWLWNLMVVRFSLAILYLLMPVIAVTVVSYFLFDEFDPLPLAPLYLGMDQEDSLSPALANRALTMLPRGYLLIFVALSLASVALLVGMYLRWRPVFYVLLVGVAIRFVLAVTAMLLGSYYGLVCGGFGVVIVVASFFIVLGVDDDFAWDSERPRFLLDSRSKGGVARLTSARAFAERGMWALAALYLRAAIAQMPGQMAGYVRLAQAYMQLGRPDLAERALQEARRIDPQDPGVAELVAMVKTSDQG